MLDELDIDLREKIEASRQKHEFLTFLILEDDVKVGIIQNETSKLIMFYDLEKIHGRENKKTFLDYADSWWWGSNQQVPIDSFIGRPFEIFQPVLTGYPKKSIKEIIGPTFSLQKHLKRIKKKKIEIVNRRVEANAI